MQTTNFSLDHFGIVSGPLFKRLLEQTGDKRKRKTAFNEIGRLCRSFSLIPKSCKVQYAGLVVDPAGQICYQLQYEMLEDLPPGVRNHG